MGEIGIRDVNIMVCAFYGKSELGRPRFSNGSIWNYIYACTIKLQGTQIAKNALTVCVLSHGVHHLLSCSVPAAQW